MSSCGYSHCRICVYQAQILTQRIIRNTNYFDNFNILLIYSKLSQFIKYEKHNNFRNIPNLAHSPIPGEKS